MRRAQQGGLTVEFVITLLPFMALLVAMIELCRFLLTGSVLDSALTLAARDSVIVVDNQDVSETVRQHIADHGWSLVNPSKIDVEGRYYPTLDDLAGGVGKVTHTNEPFAEYTLTYSYQPMSMPWFPLGFENVTTWKKTVLVVHERSVIHGP